MVYFGFCIVCFIQKHIVVLNMLTMTAICSYSLSIIWFLRILLFCIVDGSKLVLHKRLSGRYALNIQKRKIPINSSLMKFCARIIMASASLSLKAVQYIDSEGKGGMFMGVINVK